MDSSVGLVEAARERRANPPRARERRVAGMLALSFVAAEAAVLRWLPAEPTPQAGLVLALIVLYAVVSRVEFEIGNGYVVPEQLVFVPMLFVVPLSLVPLLVAAGFVLAGVPDWARGRVSLARLGAGIGDCWFAFGPVLVLAAFAPQGDPGLQHVGIYVLAFGAQVAFGTVAACIRGRSAGATLSESVRASFWAYRVDAVLSPLALMVAMEAPAHPAAMATVVPLVWLLHVFSQERKERYAASLELNQAYRGTVMLLSDVVEAEDNYTAEHCRSVVELVTEVAEEMRIPRHERQELEFAALLHDVGKIAIPKDILNKPSKLTDEEFELIKTHTIEGQLLLDRVGGLLGRVGAIVRSCHERWDGKGYPDGLAGTDIPLAARIVFACDAYNAMTTDRPYRQAMSSAAALKELTVNSGTQFDPDIVVAIEALILSKEQFPRLVHSAPAAEAVAAALAGTRRSAAGLQAKVAG